MCKFFLVIWRLFKRIGDSSSLQNSCPGLHAVDRSELSSITTKTTAHKRGGTGGFTCCVPGCFNNNKRNPELSFYNFRNGKSEEAQILQKK